MSRLRAIFSAILGQLGVFDIQIRANSSVLFSSVPGSSDGCGCFTMPRKQNLGSYATKKKKEPCLLLLNVKNDFYRLSVEGPMFFFSTFPGAEVLINLSYLELRASLAF